jgi:phage anti-repressor protein
MNELIQVVERQIGDGTIQTVNARDLHAFLEVGKDFSTWIKGGSSSTVSSNTTTT